MDRSEGKRGRANPKSDDEAASFRCAASLLLRMTYSDRDKYDPTER